ncbi:conidiophore development protein hymA [Colletotrichum tofieldiae]|uniref:Conidiophore development protein hymA n=1 Tax=Colletotrichum tofieldiae TaxID=708197 RepID=A0A161W9T2_9PEZI|nr:conidiophore development protein hymA [Colletotrichum tofieldiae]
MVRQRPIKKFAAAVGQCSAEASLYGKCIVSDYNAVHKDKCSKEFLRLKDCFLAAARKAK